MANMRTSDDHTKYPDWPDCFKGYGDGPYPNLDNGPDPAAVVAYRRDGKSVSEVCEYFGLSRIQVVKVSGTI